MRGQLTEFIDRIDLPFPHEVRVAIVPQDANGSIFYFPSPGNYVTFTCPRTILDQAKLGFAGELFILFAGSLGLSTCWMGHFNTRLANQALFGKQEGDDRLNIYCTTPIGKRPEKAGLLTSISARLFSKKKVVADHLTKDSIPESEIPPYIHAALDLACKAPSAMNNQCWYYLVKKGEDGYDVELGKPRCYKHFKWPHVNIDVGTAAAHFWAGMEASGNHVELKVTDDGESVQWLFHVKHEGTTSSSTKS